MGRRPVIVLDTHAWLFSASEPSRLGRRAAAALRRAPRIGVPAIAVWELGMLVDKKRVVLDRGVDAWAEAALAQPRVELLPLTPAIALRAASFGLLHGDPADRLILATALVHGGRLVTRDEKHTAAGVVDVLW
jgi:PIN domain nuclease of toxin-antitoxin system